MAVTLSSLAGAGAQFFDNNGVPLAGGLIYTYLAGTSTPEATYTSSTGVTAHANPIVLNAAGRIATGEVWLTSGVDYKFIVQTALFVQLGSYDNIPSINDFTTVNAAIALVYTNLANTSDITKGDALIGFKQSNASGALTGAIGKTVHQKLQESVSVKDFGATGDGTTDDTTAIQAAVNASQAVFFPVGTYKITAQITITKSTAFAMYGDGIGNSILLWTNATGGFAITMANNTDSVTIDGLTLYTSYVGGGTALSILYPVVASSLFVGARVSNIEMRGSNYITQYWTTGLRVENSWNSHFEGLHIQGSDNVPRGMVKAISMTNCFDVVFSSCYATRGEYGMWISGGEDEGLNVDQSVFLDFDTGIYFNSTLAQAGTAITNNHFNTAKFGVNFEAKQQCFISGNLIYKITGSTYSYVGINLKYGDDCRVTGNYIRNTGTSGGEIGILLDGTSNCIVSDNEFASFDSGGVGVQIGASSGGNLISNNLTYTAGTAVLNFGAGAFSTNYADKNFPATAQLLTVNSTTPSVGNDLSGQWQTANTLATTITNFTNAYETQVICVLATDANTTIQHNAGLILKGSVNYVMSAGNIITLRRDATLWREVSRNT